MRAARCGTWVALDGNSDEILCSQLFPQNYNVINSLHCKLEQWHGLFSLLFMNDTHIFMHLWCMHSIYIPENILPNSKAISCPNYEGFLKFANWVLKRMKNEVLESKSRQSNWFVSNFQSDDISPYKKMKYFLGIFKESRERSLGQTFFASITKITKTAKVH